jgi:signal peptidase II
VFLVLGLDWLTKSWAERALRLHEPVPLLGEFFQLTLSYNTGAAFGVFAGSGLFLLLVSGVIIAVLLVSLARILRSEAPVPTLWPVGLMLGGAIANFLDRLPDGRVTDFLDVGLGALRWPTFKLADSFIVLGTTALMLVYLVARPPELQRT